VRTVLYAFRYFIKHFLSFSLFNIRYSQPNNERTISIYLNTNLRENL
jgi:hypothetical protein